MKSDTGTQGGSRRKLADLIAGIRVAMLTTAAADGTLRSRPMVTPRAGFDGDLWFFTRADSPKVDEVEQDSRVNVSYAAPEEDRYVSVSGSADLVRDRARMEELWDPALATWFSRGPHDPGLALLRVSVEHAEYWDGPSATMVPVPGGRAEPVVGQLGL